MSLPHYHKELNMNNNIEIAQRRNIGWNPKEHPDVSLGSGMPKSRMDGSNIGVMLNLIQHPLFQGIAGQARNDGASKAPKSRRDGILLTDGFNRRKRSNARTLQSPEGTILCAYLKCRPFGTMMPCALFVVRRLKSTVNKVPSLRDFGAVRIVPLVRKLKPTVNKGTSLQDFSASHTAITRGHAPLLGASLQDFSPPTFPIRPHFNKNFRNK